MEDFIGRVGQSYLERKAFAVPQQLENLAKKQLTGGGEKEANTKESAKGKTAEGEEEGQEEGQRTMKKKGSGKPAGQIPSGSSEKDKEIARLKKELARSKLGKPKASSGKNAFRLKKSEIIRASNGQKALMKQAVKGDKEAKELAMLEAVEAVDGRNEKKKNDKKGKKEASGSKLAKEANIIEIAPTKRRTSSIQHNEHDHVAKSEHGGGSKSEHGGHAESTTSNAAAASEGKRRLSIASHSGHGGSTKSITPVHEQQLPSHRERFGEERALVVSQRSRSEQRHERDLYAIEVEEEVPRRRWKDNGGVVEVESSKGRMLYRVG